MLKIIVTGKIQKDATLRQVNAETVINFTVEHTNGQAGDKERKTWVQCSIWGKDVNVLDVLKKDVCVFVEGTPGVSTYQNQQNETKYNTTCTVSTYEVLGGQVVAQSNGDYASDTQHESKPAKKADKEKVEIPANMSMEDEARMRESRYQQPEEEGSDLPF